MIEKELKAKRTGYFYKIKPHRNGGETIPLSVPY